MPPSPESTAGPSTLDDPPSGWHSIRPWTAQLVLNVREITSVSVTFILSTEPRGELELDVDRSLAELTFTSIEDDDGSENGGGGSGGDEEEGEEEESEGEREGEEETITKPRKKKRSLIAQTLSKGLRVSVNNVNWQGVLIRMDEKADEAVIIVYGLMPGRQYDIDLSVVQSGQQGMEQALRRQVATIEDEPESTSEDGESPSNSSSEAHQTVSTPSTSPSPTPPPASDEPPQISLEERLNQLHHSLSLINAERETLLASLKTARKESQKADAALRSEMEALKRASEKHAASEVRARQKILALQESVKRAQAATRETEAQVEEMESELPELLKKKEEKEKEYKKVKEEADRVRKLREAEMEKEKKKQDSMRSELQSLTNKLEKLNAKKEKHESTTIPDLEQQLKAVEKEIEEQERLLTQMNPYQQYFNTPSFRGRPQAPIGRPAPIQRPTFPVDFNSNIWTPPPPPNPRQGPLHGGRSTSLHYQPPQALYRDAYQQIPPVGGTRSRSGSLNANTMLNPPSASNSAPSLALSSSPSASISPPTSTGISSTLSSRAPAFEPGKNRIFGLRISTSSQPAPIGTPAVTAAGGNNVIGGPVSSHSSGGVAGGSTSRRGSLNDTRYFIGGGAGDRGLGSIGMGRW